MLVIPSWVTFGMIAIVLWVAGTYFDKYLLQRYFGNSDDDFSGPGALMIFSSYFTIIVTITIFLIGHQKITYDLETGATGLMVGFIGGLWVLLYLYALNRTEVTRIVPIFQIVPIFGLIFSFFLLEEVLTGGQLLAGTGIIIGALILLHHKEHSYFGIDIKTLLLMFGATMILALTETAFKMVAIDANYWTAAFWMSSGFVLFGVCLYFFVKKYREEFAQLLSTRMQRVLGANSLNEVIDNTAEFIFFFAIIIGPVALVQSLNAFQPVIALMSSIVIMRFNPRYIDEDVSQSSLLQKLFGILTISIASIYLYTVI